MAEDASAIVAAPAIGGAPVTATKTLEERAASTVLRAIGVLAAMHFLIDLSAGTVQPLWQTFEAKLHVPQGGLLGTYFVWAACTSFAQLLFAWWADRAPTRWLIWVSPCVGVTCLALMGFVDSIAGLTVLLAVGGLGVAAFHPEGAAAAGSVCPEKRSRMMALFALSGYLGQSVSPYCTGRLTTAYGLSALGWVGLFGLAAFAILGRHHRLIPTPQRTRRVASEGSFQDESWKRWALLLSIGVLRITPTVGTPLILAYWLTDREMIGGTQSAFMAGVGGGSILCALTVRPKWERSVLYLLPMLAVPWLASIPFVPRSWLVPTLAATGFVLGIAMPVFISFGQQMLPHHARAASSITMGVSWGIAGGVAATAVWVMTRYDCLPQAFVLLAVTSAVAGLLSLRLPRIAVEGLRAAVPDAESSGDPMSS